MKNTFLYDTGIGALGIVDNGKEITEVFFKESKAQNTVLKETELIKTAILQINEYLSGKRTVFDLPLHLEGTEFQVDVWEALYTIPYGETRTYKEIAEQVGSPKAYRAVGMANNKNPIAIIIPCHRVIGANGKLVGYGGGIDIKARLLDLEKR
ncbi:MAG TPA: methylated-DNA--[protein]-cysteine S-methyltransferase [Syntrophomonadaceae bacterium]|nr:methylated-DNA--[protein]-cysteine S-methyltransferase [Syntrophomonadaceae bacterium]